MSTRSEIAILNSDGTVTGIYCHWDGYVDHNGRILSESYQEIEKVKKLISGGDLSSLRKEIEPTAKHSFENPQDDVCIYYHRDREEEWEYTKPKVYSNILSLCESLKDSWVEYLYLYIGGDWWYWDIYRTERFTLKHLKTDIKDLEK